MIACISRLLLATVLLSQLSACSSTGSFGRKGANNEEFASAVTAVRAQNWVVAERKLLALQQQYPDAAGVLINLGIVYQSQGREQDAEALFRQAAAVSSDADAYNLLGVSLRKQGRFADALVAYREALAIDPEHADTHRNVGILYDVYLGEPAKAKRHYLAYQEALPEPDERVAGWVMELDHRSGQKPAGQATAVESNDEQ